MRDFGLIRDFLFFSDEHEREVITIIIIFKGKESFENDDDGDYFSFMLIWKKQEVSD